MAKDPRTTEHGPELPSGELAGLRIAILAETLYEDLELWYPYYRLREAGADVFVVGSGSAETYQSKHGYYTRAPHGPAEIFAATVQAEERVAARK